MSNKNPYNLSDKATSLHVEDVHLDKPNPIDNPRVALAERRALDPANPNCIPKSPLILSLEEEGKEKSKKA